MINPEQLLNRVSPEELRNFDCIVHGTYLEPWKSIQTQGLCKMNRTHIHFAAGMPKDNGVISGMRQSCTVYIFLDGLKCAAAMERDDIEFFISANKVILTDGLKNNGVLPLEFVSHVMDSSGNILLDNRQQNHNQKSKTPQDTVDEPLEENPS